MTNQTALQTFQPAREITLSGTLQGLRDVVYGAAQSEIDALLEVDDSFTATEIDAMLKVEALKKVNGVDLAAVLLRADIVKEIERSNALANHPGRYATRDEMARDQGISPTELSQIMDLVDVIFPYIQDELGIPIANIWEEVGKSNFRELTPVLKSIITGEESNTSSVRNSVDAILDDIAATAQAAGQDINDTEVRRRAVDNLLENGARLTNRQLRRHVRPDPTPPINASVIRINGTRIVVAEMDEDQFTMFERKLGGSVEPMNIELPRDPWMRQNEAARIPELRRLQQLLEAS
jgi:hypothetical protein